MDSTVLDIGLRNHHISSVECFFKIQIETFRLTQSPHKSAGLSAEERSEQNLSLYDDWKQVFSKLNNVISANIHDSNSNNFAICLARTGLQSCNQLLTIVTETEYEFDFNRTKAKFTELFVNSIRAIRLSLRIVEKKTDTESMQVSVLKDPIKWSSSSSETQIFVDSVRSNSLVLGQYWLKKYRNSNKNWNEIIKIVILFSIKCLENNSFDDLNNILCQLGLPFEQLIQNIYNLTSDYKLRQIISTKFSEDIVLLNQSIGDCMDRVIKIIEYLKTESNISLPICWISQMSSDSIQRSFLLPAFKHTNDFECNILSPNVVWNYLIDRNDYQSLDLWTQRLLSSDSNTFPFNWSVTQDMIESIGERALITTRESILNKLAIRGMFCLKENNFQSILYRFGRIDSNNCVNPLNDFCEDSLISSNSSFSDNLLQYSCDHNLNDFLYIYYENFSQIPILSANPFTNLLRVSINCVSEPSNERLLENILITSEFVYSIESPVTIKRLMESTDVYLGLIASTYSTFNLYDICCEETDCQQLSNDSETKPLIGHLFKIQFPIIFSSFLESLNKLSANELTYEAPTVYSLLKDSVPFDVTKMFCWQSMNRTVDANEDYMTSQVFNQLPHFSNTRLADLYGLKANLTFTYYLNKGRVVEAYNRFISNRKVLNSKSIELACRRAALVAYNDTSDNHVAVACIIFQQLLSDDSTQTLLHLSVANIVMSFAADFLSLNARQQQIELSNLLKRSHYYCDKRAAAKLLQLTVTAINRKYKNFMNIQIEECFDWKIAVRFAALHNLELPLDLLIKCAVSDNWLVFAICCQLHQYSKESVFNALKHFNNECISDHLYKAFQSSNVMLADNESANNARILSRKESQKRTTKHLRNVLYSRIGVNRQVSAPEVSDNNRHSKSSFRYSISPIESDDQSIASETDYNGIETISVVSSSNTSDSEDIPKLSPENSPKDLFQIILNFQTDSSNDPRKALMYSSIPLSNPTLCLIACSADYGSEKFNTFSAFSCWLLASVHFDIRKQFCERVPNLDPFLWTSEDNYQMLDLVMRDTRNYTIFLRGLKLFNLNITALIHLFSFLRLFFSEKNYYNVQNLKSFQDSLWKYEEPLTCDNIMLTKEWIQKASVIILTTALRNAKNHELVVLLRHYEFARIQGSFSSDIVVHDFRKLYRLCQCLSETHIVLPIGELLSKKIEVNNGFKASNERYVSIIKSVISSLQLNGHFSEARSFANNADIESNDFVINEWTLRAAKNFDSFEFWEKCWDSLTAVDTTLMSAYKVFHKLLPQIPSLLVKCFLVFKCLIAAQNFDNQRESSLLEAMLWKCMVQIERKSKSNENESYIYERIWSDVIAFIKSNKKYNKINLDFVESTLPNAELNKTLDKIIEKLLNNSCIEKAHEVSVIFDYNHQDLDMILACDNMAKGVIKTISEAPLTVQLRTKAIGRVKRKEFGSDFSEEQKEIIGFIESMSSLATIGRKACQRVLLYFKISCVLHRSYSEIESSEELDDLELLKCLISVHSMSNDSLSFAKELIALNDISDENIASIICRETLFTLKNSCESDNPRDSSFSNLVEMSASFLSLVRLLNDTTILGSKLLKESEILLSDSNNNSVLTKLYIKAHECFTLACDVKGIALVLRKARLFITQNLLQLRDFNSILTLMTGIGRYSEMTYCFDLFKENNEFELLLSKRIEKAPQLRIALLDYLKGDKEVFPLVALRFCLYREIAENHEMSAKRHFNELKYRLTTNLMAYREQLETILYEFIDAYESYSKAGCHSHADSCAKLAQLMSLQINYLANSVIVINLNNSQIAHFIENNNNFFEALIVADAYQCNTSWVNAVFNHVILNGDTNYLSDYSTRRDLSNSFIEELVHKYIQFVSNKNLSNDKVLEMKKSIQKLIQCIDDYELRFRTASKLNLTEINQKMLSEESGAYLQDLRRNGLL